jgi:hypothetical protein
MDVSFTVTGVEGLTRMRRFTDRKLFDKAIRDGLKYAGRAAKTQLAKEVGTHFNLKAARIKEDISGPYINAQNAYLEFKMARRPPTAMAYGGRQVAKGLSVAFKRSSRSVITNAFVRRRIGGTVDLPFYRKPGSKRLNVLHGPSIGAIVTGEEAQFSQDIVAKATDRAFEQWAKGVERTFSAAARRS